MNFVVRRSSFVVRCIIVIVALLTLTILALADTIYMEDGGAIKGLVVEEHYDRIAFSMPEGERTIFRNEINEIFFDKLEQNYYYLANRLLSEDNFEEAEKFYAKALDVNSGYRMAQDGLLRLNDIRAKEIKKWKADHPLWILRNQIGISILKIDDFCRVNKIFEENAKLNIDDAIVSVWDESTKFMSEKEVTKRIIGIPDTPVKVTIQRRINFHSIYVPWYLKVFGIKKKVTLPLKMEVEGLTVGRLEKGSLAAKAGISQGDRIIAIDDKPTRYMPLEEAVIAVYIRKTPPAVELTIQRDIDLVREKK